VEVNETDALFVFSVIVWIKPELTENIYTKLCETAEGDLNQVGFVNSKPTLKLRVYSASFMQKS